MSEPNWQHAWRELAQGTSGITDDDPRFDRINKLLDQCDKCFEKKNWAGFVTRKKLIEEIMKGPREKSQEAS